MLGRALCGTVEQLRCASNSCCDDGTVDKAKLKKESPRVPIDTLACNPAVIELNDGDQEKFSSPASSGYSGQHPIHLEHMREPHHVLCDNVLLGEDLGNRQQLQVGRNAGQKLVSVRTPSLPVAPRPDGTQDTVGLAVMVSRAASASLSSNLAYVCRCH